jgi:RimJ/RimL family protein N-acetyltransferase
MTKIREVKLDDWDRLKDLLTSLIQEKPPVALELEPLIMKGDEWIKQFPRGNLGYFVVALEGRHIVGFCYLAVPSYYKPTAYIGVGIEKKQRRHGLATQLFYEVAQWAVSKKLQYIIADIWSWNARSNKFFSHLGFVERSRFEEKFKGEEKVKVRLVKEL